MDNSDTSATSATSTDHESSVNVGGRPKGTTSSATHDLKNKIEIATQEALEKLREIREKMKREGRD
jgi:hypothetical protein